MPRTEQTASQMLLPAMIADLKARKEPTLGEEALLEKLEKLQKFFDLLYMENSAGIHTDTYRDDLNVLHETLLSCADTCYDVLLENQDTSLLSKMHQGLLKDAKEVSICARDIGVLGAPSNMEGEPTLYEGPTSFPLLLGRLHRRSALSDTDFIRGNLPLMMQRLKHCDPWYMRSSDEFSAMKESLEQITAYGQSWLGEVSPRLYDTLAKNCEAYLRYKQEGTHNTNSEREGERIRLAEDLLKFAQTMGRVTGVQYGVEEEIDHFHMTRTEQINQHRQYSQHLRTAAEQAQKEFRHYLPKLFQHSVLLDAYDEAVSLSRNTPLPQPDSERGVELRQVIAAHILHEQMEIDRERSGGEAGALERSLLQGVKTPEEAQERLRQTVAAMAESQPLREKINEKMETPEKLETLMNRNGMRRFARDCLKEWQPPQKEHAGDERGSLQLGEESKEIVSSVEPPKSGGDGMVLNPGGAP